MITIAQAVNEIIIGTPFLGEAIEKDLINYSGFARMYKSEIEEKTHKNVTIGAVVMALKRRQKNPAHKELELLFRKSPDIIVRSNLFELTVQNSPEFLTRQKKLLEYASMTPNTLVTITHGVYETTIIASMKILDKVTKMYADAEVKATIVNVSALTIQFDTEFIDIPGVMYTILNVLAWNGIPLVEVVSTYSEFTLVVKQEDVDRVFTLVQKLFVTR